MNDKKFSELVNDFIKTIENHRDTISVETKDGVTLIVYEDYPAEPIINYDGLLSKKLKNNTYYNTNGFFYERKTFRRTPKKVCKCCGEVKCVKKENI